MQYPPIKVESVTESCWTTIGVQSEMFLIRKSEKSHGAVGFNYFDWHCLRHTFASRLVMEDVDLRIVAELRGKTLATVMRYAHLAPRSLALRRWTGCAAALAPRNEQRSKQPPAPMVGGAASKQLANN